MEYRKITPVELNLLPVQNDEQAVTAHHETAKAVVDPVPGEIRIPYVSREERGDFANLMDVLVEDLECKDVRFVAVDGPDRQTIRRMLDLATPDDARTLKEAVHGFDEEEVDDYEEPVNTLVGTWDPDNRP